METSKKGQFWHQEPNVKFNDKLVQLRKRKGLSQEEFSYEMGVSRQSVFKWESGENTPDIEKIKRIAKFYNISLDLLLNDELPLEDDHRPAPVHVEEKSLPKSVDPFEISSPKKPYKGLLITGLIIIPTSFFMAISDYFLFENMILKFLTMGVMIFCSFIGVSLVVFRHYLKNDFITINQDRVFGCSFGRPFSFGYDEIESAKLYSASFNSVGIKTIGRAKDTVIVRVANAESIIKKINGMISREAYQ